MVVGCVATWEGRVLLCRRSIEPSRGLWTLPAGYLEMGETVEEAAMREAREEANANLGPLRLLAIYNLPTFGELYVIFESALRTPQVAPGEESLETRLFSAGEIPWQQIAFPMVQFALRHWAAAEKSPDTADFIWGPDGAVRARRRWAMDSSEAEPVEVTPSARFGAKSGGKFMRVIGGRVKPGCWESYEQAYLEHVTLRTPMHGLKGRWVIRSQSDPDVGYAISLWETLAEMEAFERSDSLKREILPHLLPFLTQEFVARHCEVRDERNVGAALDKK